MFRSTSHGFVTGPHWRCYDVEESGWYSSWFDDSSWSNAFPAPNEGSASYTSAFPDQAQLIWHYDADNVNTVYCRARLCYGWRNSIILRIYARTLPIFINVSPNF